MQTRSEDEERALRRAERWGCVPDGRPFRTADSLLWPMRRGGAAVMLKVAGVEEARGAALLGLWDGKGAVRLIERDGATLLMERAEAAPRLDEMARQGRDETALHILCGVAEALARPVAAAPQGLPPVSRRWDDMERDLAEVPPGPEDRALFGRVRDLAETLLRPGEWRPLHGDLHHLNVLYSSRGWLAIDPKGYLGPRAYEFAPMLCNPVPDPMVHAPGRLALRVRAIAARTGLAPESLARWAFVHVGQCAAWSRGAERPFWLACLRRFASESSALEASRD